MKFYLGSWQVGRDCERVGPDEPSLLWSSGLTRFRLGSWFCGRFGDLSLPTFFRMSLDYMLIG